MRYAVPVFLVASPAFAHHEVVVVSVLPGLLVWLSAVVTVGLAVGRRKRTRRK